MDKIFYSLIVALLLWGCATPYQNTSVMGGFDEVQYSKNTWKVTFKGNAYTGKDTVADYCLLRCAEICLENGYKYFSLISNKEYTKNSTYSTPAYSTTNLIGNTAYTNTYGGQTYNYSKPRASNEIICFEEKPNGHSYDADFIIKSIKAKYEIE